MKLNTNRRRIAVPLAAGSALMLLAACGGNSNGSSSSTTESAAGGSDTSSCPKNADRIKELDQTLSENLYAKAFAENGKKMNTNPNPLAKDAKIKVFFSIEGLSHPFLVAQKDLAESKAKELGVEVNVVSANDDVNKQFNDIQAGIASGSSAIMMMPANTEGLSGVLADAESRNVPYAFTQKGMLGAKPVTQVLAPYAAEGENVGKWVVEHYKDQKDVKVALIEGISGDQSSVARTGAFERELLKACNFTIVASQPGQYRRDASQKAMETIIAANPDINLVFGANDEGALGALAALEAAGKKDVGIAGIDGEKDMFTAIKAKKVLVTMKHNPTSPFALENVVQYLRGEPVPEFEVNPGEVIDQENVNSETPAF